MSDLIRRQDAIDVLEERLRANGYSNVGLVSELNRSIGYIMRLPSAQPNACEYWDDESDFCALNRPSAQTEIIRCKDCKYRYKMACHKAEFYECSHIGLTSTKTGNITHVGVTDDFFCADGERRDSE